MKTFLILLSLVFFALAFYERYNRLQRKIRLLNRIRSGKQVKHSPGIDRMIEEMREAGIKI